MTTPGIPPLFDWTLMRSFLAVMDAGSLQAAARQLRSSQPTVGRHIASLERQLGSVLFKRTARQLIPTALAHTIAEHARAMEKSAKAIGRALSAEHQGEVGTVRISASHISTCYLLPPILKRLREAEPGIDIVLVTPDESADRVQREADIALCLTEPDQPSLICRKMGEVNIGVYAHKEYLRDRSLPGTLPALLKHPLIGFDNDGNIILGFKMFGVDVDKNAFQVRTDDHMTLLYAIKGGMGIGFTCTYAGDKEADFQRLLPELPISPLEMWLAVHREVRTNPRIRRVYEFLAEAISRELAGH